MSPRETLVFGRGLEPQLAHGRDLARRGPLGISTTSATRSTSSSDSLCFVV